MKRREFVQKASIGAAALAALGPSHSAGASTRRSPQQHHTPMSGPLATATVSFGAWAAGTNRRPNIVAAAGLANNIHALIPYEVTIKAGGTVNYIIAGFHVVAVYADTRPDDINIGITVPPFGAPAPPIIDDPTNRVYRGIDPTVMPFLQGPPQQGPIGPAFQPLLQDRIEVVHFPERGRYLVICAVLPHFTDGMYGYVKVNP